MSMTWQEIFPDVSGPPVKAEPGDFSAVGGAYRRMGDDAADIVTQFRRIAAPGDICELQGQAATAFERFVDEVSDSLQDLPRVSNEASTIFCTHARLLRDLRQRVAEARGRAETLWIQRRDANQSALTATRNADRLQAHIDQLPAQGSDPSADEQRTQLETQRDRYRGNASSAAGDASSYDRQLGTYRTKWDEFHREEESLRTTTERGLSGIDLGELRDPGCFEAFIEGACDIICALTPIDEILDFIGDVMRGDWAAVLWKLREVLDVLLLVLVVVALFTPLGPLALVALGLAIAKLVIDVALYATAWPNPETGQVINGWDLAMDLVDVALLGHGAHLFRTGREGLALFQQGNRILQFRNTTDVMTRSRILTELGVGHSATRITLTQVILGDGFALIRQQRLSELLIDAASLGRFQRGIVLGGGGALLSGYEAIPVLQNAGQNNLSTAVFPSIRDGHGPDDTDPVDFVVHLGNIVPVALG